MALHVAGALTNARDGTYCSRIGAVRWIALILSVAATSIAGRWWLLPLVPAAALLPLHVEWAVAIIVLSNAALIYVNTYKDIAPVLAASCLAASSVLRIHACRRAQIVVACVLAASLVIRIVGSVSAPYAIGAAQAAAIFMPICKTPSSRFAWVYMVAPLNHYILLVSPNQLP